MKTKYIAIIIGLLIFFQSCDKIDNPIKDNVLVWNNRKIVIYDFTGHKCGNCPEAHTTIKNLINIYGEAIVPIGIHCTYFAVPNDSSSNEYTYDFRTDIGDYLGGRNDGMGFYGEIYLPCGLVNNLSVENISVKETWATQAAKYISTYPEFLIELQSEVEADKISCTVNTVTNIENNRKLSLVAFLLEDKITQWQTDYSAETRDIENYEHNHVLRAGFNGAFGEEIKSDNNISTIGSEIKKSYTLDLSTKWDIANCSVVTFVYDTDTKEILQAEVVHFNE
ncbi:MAG: Omp28-related outer membrane protein [Bacteroidales bacterium]|jgi:hypothetical protein|nr:Omp28-related outer membrane protein [Bacteroidales bacterium]